MERKNVFSVLIEPSGLMFEASSETTLLQAAFAGKVLLPSSCRNGTCRTCICHLKQGHVTYRIEWPGLSREEKLSGYILPCVARAASDLLIEHPAAVSLAESSER